MLFVDFDIFVAVVHDLYVFCFGLFVQQVGRWSFYWGLFFFFFVLLFMLSIFQSHARTLLSPCLGLPLLLGQSLLLHHHHLSLHHHLLHLLLCHFCLGLGLLELEDLGTLFGCLLACCGLGGLLLG